MATTDLKTFLEDRLTVLDPAIDLSPGSPAQVQFIDPVIAYLGTDPLETDIKTFILDRFEQEFPDVFSGDPGVVSDTFIKPLILMLEPFKREIQSLRRNQSLKDPTILSDDDADALMANVFDERSSGGLAGGVARVFYPNPTNVQVEITSRFFTADGLNFYPSVPVSITAEEMVFNKSGGLFFMDITVQAEQAGVEYNIPKNTLTGVQGVTGAIKVDNPRDFSDGATKLDTPTFVAQGRGSLTERSLVTRRGATAILRQTFEGSVRAVQIIGAGDEEMQRDILSATSPGHAFLTGKVGLFQKMAYVRCRTLDSGSSTTPVVSVGDQVYVYLRPTDPTYAGVSQQDRFVRFTIAELIIGPLQHPTDLEFQVSFLVRFSETPPAVMTADVTAGKYFEGGISKKGTVTVSSLPGITLPAPATVESQTVHVLGHTDVYVRPVLQNVSSAVISSLSADPGLANLQRSTLSSYGNNRVADTAIPTPIDFAAAGVLPGNYLVVESGSDIGTYAIRKVVGSTLYLGSNLTATASNIRYRIISDLTINPFDPRILKLPFGTLPNNDLQTVIGSNTFVFTALTTDLLNYGAKVGDVIRVSGSAVDNGTFTITGFIDGQNVLVDRAAAGSESSLTYEVYTPLEAVQLPLVRLKELMVLDSAKQSTGVVVPPAEPVAVVPAGNITSAQIRDSSERPSGFILPDLTQFGSPLPVSPAAPYASTPAGRYSSGFEKSLGVYGAVVFANGSKDEFDYLGDMFGQCSYFVATAEDTTKSENFPPVDPKPGDALTLKSGPNKGDYLIKNVIKVRYRKATSEYVWAYLIQIYGTFPVDVLAELVSFINTAIPGPGPVPTFNYSTTDLAVPGYLQTTIYSNLATWLQTALLTYSATAPTIPELQAAIDSMVLVSYEWGDPARGVLRTFFTHPTLFQQHTAASLNPTTYTFETVDGALLKFRADPNRYEKQEIIPPRLESDTPPLEYPRDDEELWLLPYSTLVTDFTVGEVLTGATSLKTGTVLGNLKYGTTGTLVLNNVSGAFLASESISDTGGGLATTAGLRQPAMLFSSQSRATAFNLGVQPGDIVGVHEEFFLLGSTGTQYAVDGIYVFPNGKNYMAAVQTVFNSTQVTFVNTPTPFIPDMVGGMLFIEEGKDKGGYSIVKVLDSKNLVLDRPLTETTPTILASGDIDTWGYDSINLQDRVQSTTAVFTLAHVNKYITIYGMQKEWQGSYKILNWISASFVEVDRSTFPAIHFPTQPFAGFQDGYWVITDAPISNPTKVLSGTELTALRPIRIYRHIETEYPITTVLTSPSDSVVGFDVSKTLDFCEASPFRVFRRNIRRITPYEMSLKSEGGLFYFDTEAVSLGPNSTNNLPVQSYLTADEGTYESEGYKHIVDDDTLTYSPDESGKLFIPSTVLPVSSPDSLENVLSLVGVPLQVSYERGDVVQNVSDFVTSPEDRVTTANFLVRHFLPSYVYYDAVYTGGSAPGVIAKDIISYIDNLAVETPIDVSLIQQLIENRGGNIETPTSVFIVIHDWNRRRWMEFSANRIGGTTTLVPYNGTPRVSFFVPGPDVSGQDPLPTGERVNLTQV